ncbi:MAG: 1-(5-phosphoribosyl)-5-[(5-phosphoribosylamino)methylideneamino] imidazole-4-carboxamide isomerase [Candidatus Thorarchaeota archaeon]|nr:1-(5-phosphoribosyl)-5-[(5-phosphoribosylamino)methylideneamino] imidazole-4-carboxamide isomerase [Candidatus Thorarchaeota archaeon]
MIVIPAIDILDGRVVRLEQGCPDRELRINGSLESLARKWEEQGAGLLHLVDIGAALGRTPFNRDNALLAQRIRTRVQMAGGVRTRELAATLLDSGVYRVVMGTVCVEQPAVLEGLVEEYGDERVAVALDCDGTGIRTHGWTHRTERSLSGFVESLCDAGVSVFIVTAVKHDGMLCGPDLRLMETVMASGVSRLIAAGGIGSLQDIERVRDLGAEGVVIGRALYENRFSFSEASAAARG